VKTNSLRAFGHSRWISGRQSETGVVAADAGSGKVIMNMRNSLA